ncbi:MULTISPECIES: DUF5811 family protein [unclassified Halorhabdus]|uniref:DUF5811 family protein n=1 Tax=unclassified Halorhabdus TaxID=2621901 RepID=UPI0023DBA7F3|nr:MULTISPECIES: DUF5811 family protein [unclassified Halorhabdus]WEL17129.1 Uncharacterized protein SVXHr_0954 [Halorhabdus sp. SVX81]WEL21015.1 Uncharacterized protein HBNXHr_0946 [Halorhabdus sp. BNX81]
MYGNTSHSGAAETTVELTPEERRSLRSDLSRVASKTRELLPGEFVVGSELSSGASGPEAMIAVQPPIGSPVSAGYTPEPDTNLRIDDQECEDLAQGLAASAALQVKQAMSDDDTPTAQ